MEVSQSIWMKSLRIMFNVNSFWWTAGPANTRHFLDPCIPYVDQYKDNRLSAYPCVILPLWNYVPIFPLMHEGNQKCEPINSIVLRVFVCLTHQTFWMQSKHMTMHEQYHVKHCNNRKSWSSKQLIVECRKRVLFHKNSDQRKMGSILLYNYPPSPSHQGWT